MNAQVEPELPAPSTDALRVLAAWESRLSSSDFVFGSWTASQERADGVIQMGYYTLSPEADQFLREIGSAGLISPFDWPSWLGSPRGQELREPDAVADATPAELAMLLTAIVRSERISEGSLEGAFESGLLVAVARRAGVLTRGGPSS